MITRLFFDPCGRFPRFSSSSDSAVSSSLRSTFLSLAFASASSPSSAGFPYFLFAFFILFCFFSRFFVYLSPTAFYFIFLCCFVPIFSFFEDDISLNLIPIGIPDPVALCFISVVSSTCMPLSAFESHFSLFCLGMCTYTFVPNTLRWLMLARLQCHILYGDLFFSSSLLARFSIYAAVLIASAHNFLGNPFAQVSSS